MKILLFSNTDWYMFNFNLALGKKLVADGHEVVLLTPKGAYVDRLQQLGFRCVLAPMDRKSINPVQEFKFLVWLKRFLTNESFDIVHSFTLKCCLYSSFVAKFTTNTRLVNTLSGLGYVFTSADRKATYLRVLVQGLLKFAFSGTYCRIIVLNRDDFQALTKLGFSESRTLRIVFGAGVDRKKYFPAIVKLPRETFRVLLPARILRDKGVFEFVSAARLIRAQHLNIEFVLAGAPDPGNPSAIPESQINEWVNDKLITWLGHVENMLELYHSVDLVVLPSYREGLPTSLTEAAMCCLPLIATDVPGCRDVIENEIDGLLVPPRNETELAKQISRLAHNQELRERLAATAFDKANARFEEIHIITQNLEIYSELLGN